MLTLTYEHTWFDGSTRIDQRDHMNPQTCLDTARSIWTNGGERMRKMRVRCSVTGAAWWAVASA